MLNHIYDIATDIYEFIMSLTPAQRAAALSYIKKHWPGFIALLLIPIIVIVTNSYLQSRPQRVVEKYYELLHKREFGEAWSLLTERYHKKIGDLEIFEAHHGNLVAISYVKTHSLGIKNGVAALYVSVGKVEQKDDGTTMQEQQCYLTRLSEEKLPDRFSGFYSLFLGNLFLQSDWRIRVNNYRGVCHYHGL